jgi:tight adherence protein B
MSALLAAAAVVVTGCLARTLARAPVRTARSPGRRARAVVVVRRAQRVAQAVLGPSRRRRAARAAAAAWPSVAEEIGAGLRSGGSLHQALAAAADRGGPAGARLATALRPVERGGPLAETAGRWAEAAVDTGEQLVAHAVELVAVSGHATPLVFDTVADGLRERGALAGELRAQTAQARASAFALGLLPLAFTGLLSLTDPTVPAFLFRSPAGWACLAVGLGLQAAGGWWMHRIIGGVHP